MDYFRFGDQILQINSENVAGFSSDKVHDMLRKSSVNNITMIIRDRPFERTLTLHKVRKEDTESDQKQLPFRTPPGTLDSSSRKAE